MNLQQENCYRDYDETAEGEPFQLPKFLSQFWHLRLEIVLVVSGFIEGSVSGAHFHQ